MKFIISCLFFLLLNQAHSQNRIFINSQVGVAQTIVRYNLEKTDSSVFQNYFENTIVNRFNLEFFLNENVFIQGGISINPALYRSQNIEGFANNHSGARYEIPFLINRIFLLRKWNTGDIFVNFSIGVSYNRRHEYFLSKRIPIGYLLTKSNAGIEIEFFNAGRFGLYAGWGQRANYSRKLNICDSGNCNDYQLIFGEKYLTLFLSYSYPLGRILYGANYPSERKGLKKLLFLPEREISISE